ncbi:GNAT family N-acetyltransferase [Mucilaginibacter mallensis]|nr:GNAT family N-acetyltransferase [Mucilaginibacter mallensis]
MHTILETPRLIIREFLPDEQDIYLNHFTDEEVCRHIPKRTTDERIKIFLIATVNYQTNKKLGIWGMFNKANGVFIGSCLLRLFDEPDKIELGYSMERKYWGQGIATEMAEALIEYAFTDADVNEVVAVTTLENIASQRVLEKAGLVRTDNVMRNEEELAFFRKSRG